MLTCLSIQAQDEYQILEQVHSLIEADYVDGKPRHHLESARNIEYLPGASCYFIIDYNDFQKLSAATIQAIAWDRSILIQNCPQPEFNWSLDTLGELGALDQSRDIQGNVFSSTAPSMLMSTISGSISR